MQRKLHIRYTLVARSAAALVAASPGCDKLKARDLLNKGVQPIRAASSISPSRISSKPRNSTRLSSTPAFTSPLRMPAQYIPGAPSQENVRNG